MLIGREITVIGGGIAGFAVALATAMRGAQVTMIEQAPEIGEVGAGIQISPNGWRVLSALGLEAALAAASPRADAVALRDFRRGAEVYRLRLDTPGQGPYHFVHRVDLIAALEAAARAAGVEIRLGERVVEVAPTPTGAAITFADGRREQRGLTLAADGLHSPARRALNPRSRPYFTGQVAWRCTVESDGAAAPEAHVFMGPGRHLVRYPLRDRRLINIVAVEERDRWAAEGWHHRDDPEELRRAFVDFCPEVGDLLARAEDVYLWGLFRHPVAEHWAEGQVALLGDAAHPTLPFLAQGANMALEDAMVLARVLADGEEPAASLARYQALRRGRAVRIVAAASENAQNYHLRPGPYRAAAHLALRAASRFAPQAVSNRLAWIYRYDATAAE